MRIGELKNSFLGRIGGIFWGWVGRLNRRLLDRVIIGRVCEGIYIFLEEKCFKWRFGLIVKGF